MRDDIQHIYEHVDKSIEIEDEQKEMLSNVFTLGENTAYEVMILRRWRDDALLPSPIGKKFVKLYYKISPFITKYVKKYQFFKNASKFLLNKLIQVIKK